MSAQRHASLLISPVKFVNIRSRVKVVAARIPNVIVESVVFKNSIHEISIYLQAHQSGDKYSEALQLSLDLSYSVCLLLS